MRNQLPRNRDLRVAILKDGLSLKKGTVYLVPPLSRVRFEKGRVHLKDETPELLPEPINDLFKAGAESHGDRCIAVLLLGKGSDGIEGIRSIKQLNGLTVVQEPGAISGKLLNAIRAKLVDLILPVDRMIPEISRIIRKEETDKNPVTRMDPVNQPDLHPMAFDITRRKALEDRLSLFEIVVEKSSNGIVITDADEGIVYVNQAWEELTGYHLEEIKGQVPGHFLQGELTDSAVIAKIRQAVSRKVEGTFETVNYTKDGRPFWIRMLIQPFFNFEGEHEGFFAIQQDVTEQKKASEQLQSLNRMLTDKNAELEDLNRELEAFAYAVSHDLKEPLKNILGLMDLLEASTGKRLQPDEAEFIDLAKACANRMSGMIGALLDYSRTGHPSEPVTELDIAKMIASLKGELSHLITETGANISLTGKKTRVRGYKTALYRLLQNLITNSMKYRGKEPPVIRVEVTEEPDHWTISVTDNGVGIPADKQAEVFKLFNRVSSSDDSNGIGLALCQRIAALHHGQISLSSEVDKGSVFTTTISKHLAKD